MKLPAKESVIAELLAMEGQAREAFRSRWRLSTLERLDPELHERLREQQALYDSAMLKGTEKEAREQAEAMVRGWRAACAAMEHPLQPDDAYFVGWDINTGTRVCIGDCKKSAARAQQVEGDKVIFMTPDEVATMFAGLSIIRETKAMFPDAELLSIGEREMKQ